MPHSRYVSLRSKQWLWALLAVLLPAVLYANTLAPSIVIGDSAEFQTEAWRLGVAHPTGYPLYLLLGRIFAFVFALGDAALRLNLFSAVCALATLWLFFDLVNRLTHHPFVAVTGTWLAAVGPAFWSQAIIAEVYALHALLVLATLNTLLRWQQTRDERWIVLTGLAIGLGLAHHRTIVLLLPAAGLYIWLSGKPYPMRHTLLKAAVALILPVLLYAYVPLRWPVVYHRWPRWSELVDFLLARGYSYALQFSLLRDAARWRAVGELALHQLTWAGLGLVGAGVLAMARKFRRELVLLGLTLITFLVFGTSYQVPDVAVFFIPAWLTLALLAAMGVDALADLIAQSIKAIKPGTDIPWSVTITTLLPIGIAIALITGNLPTLDRGDDLAARAIAEQALAHPPQKNALIVCDFERLSALRYTFGVQAPDLNVEANMPDTEEMAYHLIEQALSQGRPVYLARPLPGVAERYRLTSHGPLVRISTEPEDTLPDSVAIQPREITFADQSGDVVALIGHDAPALAIKRGETFALTLYWQALFAPEHSPPPYQVHLYLADGDGNMISHGPQHHPVDGFYPINAWQPGQVVADYTLFHVGAEVPPGEYRLEAAWTLPFS
ncbi:MAG: DUF2723 domain-containing protein, partial [Anaerolineae bacterium]|nr:DUF2723 domain-containing protein [Anaerolineae bacterium]